MKTVVVLLALSFLIISTAIVVGLSLFTTVSIASLIPIFGVGFLATTGIYLAAYAAKINPFDR